MLDSDYLTTAAAARLLGRSSETVRYYERTGRLRALRTTTGTRIFHIDDVLKFARELGSRK